MIHGLVQQKNMRAALEQFRPREYKRDISKTSENA